MILLSAFPKTQAPRHAAVSREEMASFFKGLSFVTSFFNFYIYSTFYFCWVTSALILLCY